MFYAHSPPNLITAICCPALTNIHTHTVHTVHTPVSNSHSAAPSTDWDMHQQESLHLFLIIRIMSPTVNKLREMLPQHVNRGNTMVNKVCYPKVCTFHSCLVGYMCHNSTALFMSYTNLLQKHRCVVSKHPLCWVSSVTEWSIELPSALISLTANKML